MIRVIEMPKLSDTMEVGGISEWFKKEGDFVEEGDPLLSIETDKAVMEYVSPDEGFLLKILEKPKAQVSLGVPIAVLGGKGESFDLKTLTSSEKEETGKAQNKKERKKTLDDTKDFSLRKSLEQRVQSTSLSRIKASPLAKKIAKDKGIELSSLVGSGPYGRVIASDVEKVRQSGPVFSFSFPKLEEKHIPLTAMRRTIAKRLSASKQEAPHFYLSLSCKTGELTKWKALLNKNASSEKISLNDLLLFVCSRALTKHPEVNSLWQGDSVLHCGSVDISIAVALPEGLITPVVRSCERKSLAEISKESKELVKKAKSGKLAPDDYTGGSFTVSNLGMTRIDSFTAVINSPQTCILAVGRSGMKPVVQDNGSIIAEELMTITLSCDHRAVDGYMGALFLETLVNLIENPLLLFS